MARAGHYCLYMLIGAGAYWIPDIVVQWLRPPLLVWMAMITFFSPAATLACWLLLSRRRPHSYFRTGLPLAMLLGIWLFGPLCIAIGMAPHGGKFLQAGHLQEFLMLWAIFPVSTPTMATYGGSLGGIGLVTLALLVAAIVAGIQGRIADSMRYSRMHCNAPPARRPYS